MARRNDGDAEPRGNGLLIISAVIVLVVVLLGIFVAVTGDGGGDGAKGAAAHPAGTGAAHSAGGDSGGGGASPGASAAEGCKPTDTDQSLPTSAPEDVTWSLAQTVALPRSRSAGPMVVNGLTATCYAHTPRGAVMAAMNGLYRSVLAAPDTAPLRAQVLPGAGRTALEQQLAKVDQKAKPGEMAQIAGFRVVSYTPQTAVVTLVNGSTTAHSLKASDITVQWSDGDWKVVARADGALSTPADHIDDLVGYVQFGGV